MVKSTQTLLSLEPGQLAAVHTHPVQAEVRSAIAEMVTWLRDCRSPGDYLDLQRELFAWIYDLEKRRSACVRAHKRLRSQRPHGDDEGLPGGRDSESSDEWELEQYIYARLARQMRTVGDGLAWRCFEFDRRVVLALSRNQSPGPMAEKKGLSFELGHVERFWAYTRQFGLLHDLTNCLRISDVTEFRADGQRVFIEVKASQKREQRAQTERAQRAVDALMRGGALPGSSAGAHLAPVSVPMKTNLGQMRNALDMAAVRGCRGMKLPQGRALVAADIDVIMHDVDATGENARERWEKERAGAIRRAGISRSVQTVSGSSLDTAARSATMVPLTIYPLPPDMIASLVCDRTWFDTTISVDDLAQRCRDARIAAEVVLPERSGPLGVDAQVMRVTHEGRVLVVHQHALGPLLYELVEPATWVAGLRELLAAPSSKSATTLEMVFANEAATWR